ncbi:MAG TPA: hypothetical protein DEA43_00635 [Candidatus Moranbacteria bacterium]|nr:hypothetical protein [Candidatus Moranbacteria bacterium]HBT45377.1 hypothetical protein [Candidatus Moranbacteria bacterium]
MSTVRIVHNDLEESMEEIARDIFGSSVRLTTEEGSHGEKILYVVGENVTPHAIADLERMDFVLCAEFI